MLLMLRREDEPVAYVAQVAGVPPEVNRAARRLQIPIKDNPRAMKSVTDAFEACFRVLEIGEAVGIFPGAGRWMFALVDSNHAFQRRRLGDP